MPFEYDLIVKTLSERYMDRIASFVRGVDVAVKRIEDKEAVGGTEDFGGGGPGPAAQRLRQKGAGSGEGDD